MQINILGNNIHYSIIGEEWLKEGRDLLVFLHEGLGSIGQWKNFPEKLSSELQLPALVYDRVGYGKSDYWKGKISSKFLPFEALAMFPSIIEELNITNNIIIFGHSDGGTIGLIQCSNPIPSLKAAIIEAPHVIFEDHSMEGIKKARKILDSPEILKAINRYHFGRAEKLIDDWTSFWLNSKAEDWELLEELKRVNTPILLIQGEEDDFGTFKQIDTIENLVKSHIIDIQKLENCGHIPHLQHQNTVIKLTKDFLLKL